MIPSAVLNVLSLICNLAVVVFMLKALITFFTVGGSGNMKVKKTSAFVYFTVQSNLFMGAAALIMLVFNVILLFDPGVTVPYWVVLVNFVMTVAVMLTFCVVMFVFVPVTGLHEMIEGDNIFLHAISPIIALVTFVFFEYYARLRPTAFLWALLPVVVYGIVYYVMVIIVGEEKGGWKDFYGFNKNGKWAFSALMILVMTLVIAAAVYFGHNCIACG